MISYTGKSQSLLFRSAVWFDRGCRLATTANWSQSLLFRSAVWFLKWMICQRATELFLSQSLLFRSAVWFIPIYCLLQVLIALCRNPFYSGLLFDSENDNERKKRDDRSQSLLFRSAVWFKEYSWLSKRMVTWVAIPSIQVCCLIHVLRDIDARMLRKVAIPSIQVCCLIQMKSWWDEEGALEVAIPSIQVCCLIHVRLTNFYGKTKVSRNPFYSGLLFDSYKE